MNFKILTLLSIMLGTSLLAYNKEEILQDYQEKEFKKVCLESADFYKNGGKDEELLSIIGDACAKSDYINPLGYIVKNLISTPDYRQNASYFATIILHKKLLYQFINDDLDLSNIRLPRTEHILSITFEYLATKKYEMQDDIFVIRPKEDEKILIYKKIKDGNTWFIIEEYKNEDLIKQHWYI